MPLTPHVPTHPSPGPPDIDDGPNSLKNLVRDYERGLIMAALEASVKAAKEARGRHPATVKAVPDAAADAPDGADEAEEAPARKKAARSRTRKSA